MRRCALARLAALFLLLSAVPGVEGLATDLVHLAADGHTSDDPGHEHEESDDCCSGLFHLCSCHHNVGGVGPDMAVRVPVASAAPPMPAQALATLRLRGYRAPPYRPPAI